MVIRESAVRKKLMFLSIMRVWEMLLANACIQNEPCPEQDGAGDGTGDANAPRGDECFSPVIDDEGYNHQDFLASMRQVSRTASENVKGKFLNFPSTNLLS